MISLVCFHQLVKFPHNEFFCMDPIVWSGSDIVTQLIGKWKYFLAIVTYRISSNSFRGIYSFQVLPAAATKRGRLLNEGGYY